MSETKYGFLNGVPIDPGEGWEIVSEKEARFFYGADMRASFCYTVDGDIWILTNAPNWTSNILAFRRPIVAKQTLQAGQGETTSASLNVPNADELAAAISTLHAQLAAQSVALEKAEGGLKRIRDYPVHSEMVGSALNLQEIAQETLAEITAAKEIK